MTRKEVGKIWLREGKETRLFTKLQCDECGAIVYERKKKKIQAILNDEVQCIHCNRDCHHYIRHTDGGREKLLPNRQRPYHRRHYKSDTRAYRSWSSMLARCLNENHHSYPQYGGRGIKVCQRWQDSFMNFWMDMGDRPEGTTIERIDSDGDYEPGNCKWTDWSTQMGNRRSFLRDVPAIDEDAYLNMNHEEREEYCNRIRADRRRQQNKDRHKRTYKKKLKGWWRENFGLYHNPYIYGPMPWKKTSRRHRRQEAIERGWYTPKKDHPKYLP